MVLQLILSLPGVLSCAQLADMIADAFKDAKRFLTIISLMSILNSFLKRDLPFLPLVFPACPFFLFAAKKKRHLLLIQHHLYNIHTKVSFHGVESIPNSQLPRFFLTRKITAISETRLILLLTSMYVVVNIYLWTTKLSGS